MDIKFSVAVHILVMISESEEKLTSEKIALSVNTNPSYIRKIISLLKKSNLLERYSGSFEYGLKKTKDKITLYEIYKGVNRDRLLFTHQNSNKDCPIGLHINNALDPIVEKAEKKLEQELSAHTLNDVIESIKLEINKGEKIWKLRF